MLRNVKALFSAAAFVVAAAVSVSVAAAQSPGGAPVAAPVQSPSPQALFSNTCFGAISSLAQTQNSAVAFSNTGFATFAAATLSVPSGTSRCIKVVFTVEASANSFCFVEALIDGFRMNPDGGGDQRLVSVDGSANAHAYEWVRRVGSGSHSISLRRRVSSGSCVFDDWTFDVQVYG